MSETHFNGPLAHLLRSLFTHATPDPWPAEVDVSVRATTAIPLCRDCLYPQEEQRSFCPHCGTPIGELVPLDPYLQIFLIGDTLRKGVLGPPERRTGAQLFLIAFSLIQYAVLAPVYWFWMVRRAQGKPICIERRRPIEFEEPT